MVMYCPKCGKQYSDNVKYCSGCGYQFYYSPETYYNKNGSSRNNNYQNNSGDNQSVGLNILSLVIPLVGLVLYFNYKNNYPNKANAILTYAIVGFVLNMLFTIALM